MQATRVFLERLGNLKRVFTPPVEAPHEISADWYAGLCVDPHSFSDQLARFQNSLRAAAYPEVHQQVTQREAIEASSR
jgi:hypothetical protein